MIFSERVGKIKEALKKEIAFLDVLPDTRIVLILANQEDDADKQIKFVGNSIDLCLQEAENYIKSLQPAPETSQ